HKYTWESTAFPRKFRLYFSVCSGGASSRQMSEGWARPEPVEIAAFPTQRMIRWANPETVRVKYRWLDDQKPHFHPLATPSGRVLTGDAPRDHPWHHGLCIGF